MTIHAYFSGNKVIFSNINRNSVEYIKISAANVADFFSWIHIALLLNFNKTKQPNSLDLIIFFGNSQIQRWKCVIFDSCWRFIRVVTDTIRASKTQLMISLRITNDMAARIENDADVSNLNSFSVVIRTFLAYFLLSSRSKFFSRGKPPIIRVSLYFGLPYYFAAISYWFFIGKIWKIL